MQWLEVGKNCLRAAMDELDRIGEIAVFDRGQNPHTSADLVSHEAIVKFLRDSGISCDLLSEEHHDGQQVITINGGGVQVFADPIDNTVFFIRGEKSFCSVGMFVVENGQPKYSFVGDLASGDIYCCDWQNAYKNDQLIKVPQGTLGKPILAGWAPYSPRMEAFYGKFSKLPPKEYLMFNFGAVLQSAKITDGRYDACFEIIPTKLQEFAGAIIAHRAGAEISTLEGNPIIWEANVKQTMLVSRDKKLHQEILARFN